MLDSGSRPDDDGGHCRGVSELSPNVWWEPSVWESRFFWPHGLPNAQSSRRRGARCRESLAKGLEVQSEEASKLGTWLPPGLVPRRLLRALTFPASILARHRHTNLWGFPAFPFLAFAHLGGPQKHLKTRNCWAVGREREFPIYSSERAWLASLYWPFHRAPVCKEPRFAFVKWPDRTLLLLVINFARSPCKSV